MADLQNNIKKGKVVKFNVGWIELRKKGYYDTMNGIQDIPT